MLPIIYYKGAAFMNYQEIKSLFPSSSLQTTNNHSPDDIAIPVEAGFIRIPKKELTAREEELLTPVSYTHLTLPTIA